MVVANLNGEKTLDTNRCPPILRDKAVVHVAFRARIIQKALDDFCERFSNYQDKVNLFYPESVYKSLHL